MSRTYIPVGDRRIVRSRARGRCEYCLIHEEDTGFGSEDAELGCQIDHVIAEKHGGATVADNLAYSCVPCNRNKGSDLASLSYEGVITRFFNPRTDVWDDHFRLEGSRIVPITAIGEATDRIFAFNTEQGTEERENLQALGHYPAS